MTTSQTIAINKAIGELEAGDLDARLAAYLSLACIGEEAVPYLRAFLGRLDLSGDARFWALSALGRVGIEQPSSWTSVADLFRRELEAGSAEGAFLAIQTVSETKDLSFIEPLVRLLGDSRLLAESWEVDQATVGLAAAKALREFEHPLAEKALEAWGSKR